MPLTDTNIQQFLTPDQLAAFTQRWHVAELSLFGSILRDDFGPASDIDVLISFQENAPWSLWDLTAMEDELRAMTGRSVDLIEKEGLRNPFRREQILKTRKVIYVGSER